MDRLETRSITEIVVSTTRVKTGLTSLDRALDGGVVRGHITEIFGPPGAGKTQFALNVAANAFTEGRKVIWIETWEQFPYARFEKLLDPKLNERVQSGCVSANSDATAQNQPLQQRIQQQDKNIQKDEKTTAKEEPSEGQDNGQNCSREYFLFEASENIPPENEPLQNKCNESVELKDDMRMSDSIENVKRNTELVDEDSRIQPVTKRLKKQVRSPCERDIPEAQLDGDSPSHAKCLDTYSMGNSTDANTQLRCPNLTVLYAPSLAHIFLTISTLQRETVENTAVLVLDELGILFDFDQALNRKYSRNSSSRNKLSKERLIERLASDLARFAAFHNVAVSYIPKASLTVLQILVTNKAKIEFNRQMFKAPLGINWAQHCPQRIGLFHVNLAALNGQFFGSCATVRTEDRAHRALIVKDDLSGLNKGPSSGIPEVIFHIEDQGLKEIGPLNPEDLTKRRENCAGLLQRPQDNVILIEDDISSDLEDTNQLDSTGFHPSSSLQIIPSSNPSSSVNSVNILE